MASRASSKRRRRAQALLQGARQQALEQFKSVIAQAMANADARQKLQAAVAQRTRKAAANKLREALQRTPGEATPSLAQILREGPVPGRLQHPQGRLVEGPAPAPGLRTSNEPLPGEFEALERATRQVGTRKVPLITDASRQAAQRMGVPLRQLYQFLYRRLQSQVRKRDGHQGQHGNLFGALAERGLQNDANLLVHEADAIDAALKARGLPTVAASRAALSTVAGTAQDQAATLVLRQRPAPGVYDLELQDVYDAQGKLVTDRLRGLLDLRNDPPAFTIVSIGESKAKSGYNKILPQLAEDVSRLLEGFRSTLDGGDQAIAFKRLQVGFGPRLVITSLSERAPPAAHLARSLRDIARVFTKSGKRPPQVSHVAIDPASTFADARTIAAEFQAALNALGRAPQPANASR